MIKRTIRARLRRPLDRGDILMEAIVTMGLVGLVAGSFSQVAVGANQSARVAQYTDVASQASQGVIEKANSLPWSALGFTGSENGYRAEGASGQPTAKVPASTVTARQVLQPKSATSLRGIRFDLRTDITWRTTPALTGTGDFGVKQIAVAATWQDNLGHSHTITTSATRAPSVAEAIPSDIANPTGDGNYVYPALQAMLDSTATKVQVAWTASTRYSNVIVQRAGNAQFTAPTDLVTGQTAGTKFDDAAGVGKLNYYRVKAITPNGQAIYSEAQAVFVPVAPTWGDSGSITWPTYSTAQATATLQASAGAFTSSGTVKEIALAGKTSVARADVTGMNYFRIKFVDTTGATTYSPVLQRDNTPIVLKSVVQAGDGSTLQLAWDRSADDVDASGLTIQLSNSATFATGVVSVSPSSTSQKSVATGTGSLTPGSAYGRIGFQRGGETVWSNSVQFTVYKRVLITATQTTASGVVKATLGSGQKLADWPQLASAVAVMPDGKNVTLTDAGATSAKKALADGTSAAVSINLTMKNGDILTASTRVSRPAGPKIISVGSDHNTVTIDKSFGSWLGADSSKYMVVQWVANMDGPWAMTKTTGITGGTKGYWVDLIVYEATDTDWKNPLYSTSAQL